MSIENDLNQILSKAKLIDLTHTLDSTIPTWNGSCGFEHAIKMDYPEGCRVQNIKMHAGVGTHMDAPSHFIPNAASISNIPIEKLIIPGRTIDISNKNDPHYNLSTEDINAHEKQYGKIPKNSFVIGYTGWGKYWSDPLKYRNPDKNGIMIFPGFSKEASELLIEREVVGIGIDTLSPDRPDTHFPVHNIMLGNDKYIIENIANADLLPAHNFYFIALPLKVANGTESAIRAIAIVQK